MPRKRKTQAPRAATGQEYGQAQAQLDAQAAVPLPDNTQIASPAPTPMTLPGAGGAFARVTDQPAEPVTAGAPLGPGAGPDPNAFPSDNDPILWLEAAYQRTQWPEMWDLLQTARQARDTRREDTPVDTDLRQPL